MSAKEQFKCEGQICNVWKWGYNEWMNEWTNKNVFYQPHRVSSSWDMDWIWKYLFSDIFRNNINPKCDFHWSPTSYDFIPIRIWSDLHFRPIFIQRKNKRQMESSIKNLKKIAKWFWRYRAVHVLISNTSKSSKTYVLKWIKC